MLITKVSFQFRVLDYLAGDNVFRFRIFTSLQGYLCLLFSTTAYQNGLHHQTFSRAADTFLRWQRKFTKLNSYHFTTITVITTLQLQLVPRNQSPVTNLGFSPIQLHTSTDSETNFHMKRNAHISIKALPIFYCTMIFLSSAAFMRTYTSAQLVERSQDIFTATYLKNMIFY